MKKLILFYLLFSFSIVFSQIHNNNTKYYFVNKIDTTNNCFSAKRYCSIGNFENNLFIYFHGGNSYLTSNLSLEQKRLIQIAEYIKFPYIINQDTIGYLHNNIYDSQYSYAIIRNDSLITYLSYSDTLGFKNSYNRIWTGKYYFEFDINNSNGKIKILDRNLHILNDSSISMKKVTEHNSYFELFMGVYLSINFPNLVTIYANHKLQKQNDTTVIFSFAVKDTLSQKITLYSYKTVFNNEQIESTLITKFEDINIMESISNSSCAPEFYFTDLHYSNNFDTLYLAVSNRTDSIYHLKFGQDGYYFPPGSRGIYEFTINEPNAIKKISQTDFTVFPNPSTGELNITAPGNKTIYNYLGQKILETQENKIVLRKGMYVIESGGIRKKVVVE